MYDAAIPFNAVTYRSFAVMIESIGQFGVGLKPPSYHEVHVPLLNNEVAEVQKMMKNYEDEWRLFGCSIMADGWTDKKQRTLINFLVNSPKGTFFLESVDASDYAKTGERMFELLDIVVERVGEANVVQVVTDSASNNVLAGKLLEAKRPHLYWTPCAAHCIDLMLEDIGKMPNISRTIKRAMNINSYIYVRPGLVNMLRSFTGKVELVRPAVTRFATSFLALQRIHKQRTNLRKMFTSIEWTSSKWAKETGGKQVQSIIYMVSFWSTIVYILKIFGPLVRVLRLVDGEKRPAIGYIYEAMDRAKETIMSSFNGKEDKYKEVLAIVDRRWENQLHRPLHAAAHYLNPEFFYSNPEMALDGEVMRGLYQTMQKLIPSPETQDIIMDQLSLYRNAEGLFGMQFAVRHRKTKSPAEWWQSYGADTPDLNKFAVKILSLTCSSSGCERNWSFFEHVHCKKRNRLPQQRLNDLVFVKYNRALRRRYDSRDRIDPISLKDIDDNNEWLMGRMEEDEEVEQDDDIVFDDELLTWGAVARASGVEEDIYSTRLSKGKMVADKGSTSKKKAHTQTMHTDDVEDEEE
ncbi:hypothetical protein KSP39_PZI010745 [Platanthera zijinensis]|uniref:DUF659 domain-containing protein n=1 Tax=Platanthera zijinensis TaxID=2320716 RepID=A0AAP0G779_9ASPA